MFQISDLRRQSLECSSQPLVFGGTSKLNTDFSPKRVTDSNLGMKVVLNEFGTKPKFIEQIELKCSLKTTSTFKTDQKDFQEKDTFGGCLEEAVQPNKNFEHYPLKILTASDLIEPMSESFSSNCLSMDKLGSKKQDPTQYPKNEEQAKKKDLKQKNISFNRDFSLQEKKIAHKSRSRLSFRLRRVSNPINTNAINLIHDKAFGPYEQEKDGFKKRENLARKKSGRFVTIIRKHVDKHSSSRIQSLWTIMGKVKKMRPHPLKWKMLRFVDKVRESGKKMIISLRNFMKIIRDPINPDGLFVLFWEAIIMGLVFLDLFLLPFTYAFEDELIQSVSTFGLIDTIQFSLYLLNILINLDTSYYDKEENIISSRTKILRNYFRGALWIDIISSFPYRWTIRERSFEDDKLIHQSFMFVKLLRFLRILRIFKVFKSSRILKKIEQHEYSNPLTMGLLNLIKLSLKVLYLAHWCACFWYLLAITNITNSWLERARLETEEIEERYIASFYFTITTMLTVGYGDISPSNLRERTFGIFLMIIGGGLFGYTMTRISEIIKSLERDETKQKKKLKAMAIYMRKKGLNKDTQQLVKKYLKFVHENEDKTCVEDDDLLSMLSNNIREKISKQINGKFVNESPLFKQILTEKMKNVIPLYLEESIVSPEEVIYSKNDPNHSLYFLSKGKVHLHYENFLQPLAKLKNGSYFGIETFFTDEGSIFQATSIDFSHVIYITRSKFQEILETHPTDKETFSMMKDDAKLYNDYSSLQIRCYGCNKTGHTTYACPEIHLVVNREETIKQYLNDHKTFSQSFQRLPRKTFKPRENLSILESKALKLQRFLELKNRNVSKPNDCKEYVDLEIDNAEDDSKEVKETTLYKLEGLSEITLDRKGSIKKISIKTNKVNAFSHFDVIAIKKMKERSNSYSLSLEKLFGDEKSVETEFEFDRIRNYEVYFSHNNLSKILEKVNLRNINNSTALVLTTNKQQQHLIERMWRIFSLKKNKSNKSASFGLEVPELTVRRKSADCAAIKTRFISMHEKQI